MEAYRQYTSLGKRLEAQLHRTRERNNTTAPTTNTAPADVDLEAISSSSTDIEDTASQLEPIDRPLSKIGTNLAAALTGISHRDHPNSSDTKVFVVGFEGPNDPLNPRNWSLTKRVFCTLNVGIIALVVGMAASIDSAVISRAAQEFGVSEVAEALATGLVSCHNTSLNWIIDCADTTLLISSLLVLALALSSLVPCRKRSAAIPSTSAPWRYICSSSWEQVCRRTWEDSWCVVSLLVSLENHLCRLLADPSATCGIP